MTTAKMLPLESLTNRRVKVRQLRYPPGSIQSRYHGEAGTIVSMDLRLSSVLVLMDGRAAIDGCCSLPARTLSFHLDDLELL
jgi:hypothetical protein